MNYHDIKHDDMLNGDGLRVTLFVSGCEHHCRGCHNPQTWRTKSGIPFDEDALDELKEQLNKSYISGITLSGGDPLNKKNRFQVELLLNHLKYKYPGKSVWVYTGYLFEKVKKLELMKYVDVLVDGKFVKRLADVNYKWAGSTNQRIINVQESLKQDTVVLWV